MENPLFAFLGTSIDSTFALEALAKVGLEPALVVDTKELPDEIYNTDWDFILVCSYGKILRKKLLDLPKHGVINIHPSLLPKFRGPSPYVSNILADDRTTGVSVMLLAEEMDAGAILAQARTKKFTDEDALLDLSKPREAFLKIRAFDKSPRAHFINEKGKRVVVTEASWSNNELVIEKVLPDGKKEMLYEDYQRGQR